MKLGTGTYALMVTVVLWGVLLGGVVYSHMVFFPVYLSHLPESAVLVNGDYAINEAVFWMTIHPVLIFSLVISLIANWSTTSRRNMIGLSFAVYVVIIVISMLYFVPELAAFHNSPRSGDSAADWLTRGWRWQILSWCRGLTLFVFSVPLLLALVRPQKTNGAG